MHFLSAAFFFFPASKCVLVSRPICPDHYQLLAELVAPVGASLVSRVSLFYADPLVCCPGLVYPTKGDSLRQSVTSSFVSPMPPAVPTCLPPSDVCWVPGVYGR